MTQDNYTQFTPVFFADELTSRKEQYLKHWEGQGKDPVHEMAQIAYREVRTKRDAYLRFGPYWWAVKQVLQETGLLPGSMPTDDSLVKSIYSGGDEIDTLILAFVFREYYDANFFQGTREFNTGDEFSYQLLDEDVELELSSA